MDPSATPTTASFGNSILHTPKTSTTFPSHFQDAFQTPQMATYHTFQQPQYSSMTPVQRPQSSSEVLRSNFYANMQASVPQGMQQPGQAAYGGPLLSPVHNDGFQVSPVQPGMQPFDSSQMQTPPPTRGTTARKAQQAATIAFGTPTFGTPSTIASRRFMTPQQPAMNTDALPNMHAQVQYPQSQFSPAAYQFATVGPASAPVMPQTQLLWDQTGSPVCFPQQRPLEDPFAPGLDQGGAWPQHSPQAGGQPVAFETPAMVSFPVQPPHPRPSSAVMLRSNVPPLLAPQSTSASLDPSLIYSSPIRPVVQYSSQTRPNLVTPATKRKDSAAPNQARASKSPTDTTPSFTGPGLRRSNTTGTARPNSVQYSTASADLLGRSNSASHMPRTASPLKRIGRAPLGSISEYKPTMRASVILTVDENGNARTETRRADDSPTRSIRERYPGLFDSDTSDDESDTSEQAPSRSASFTFAKGEDRRSKAARLDPPVENLEGIDLPRSSSRASNKSVTPSRAAIAAAASLRRQGSLRKPSRTTPAKRNTMTRSASSLLDTCPMDMSADQQQMGGAVQRTLEDRSSWEGSMSALDTAPSSQPPVETALDAHNRRWSMMSFDQQQHVSPQHQQQHVGGFRPAQPSQQTGPLIRQHAEMPTYEGLHRRKNFPPQVYGDLNKLDLKLLAPVLAAAPSRNSPSYAMFEHTTSQLIAELPSHLRSKLSFLTAFCSQHKKLNALPVISLWNAIRREVESELATVWSQAGLTLTSAHGHFIARVMHYPWFSQSRCAACSLSQLGVDDDLLIALGAITLATLTPRNWNSSKRVFFLQGLMEGRAKPDHAAGAIQRMVELGSQFRGLRDDLLALDVNGLCPCESATMLTSDLPQGSAQSARWASRSDRPAVKFAGPCHSKEPGSAPVDVLETTAADRTHPSSLAPPSLTIARKPVQSSERPNVFEHAFGGDGAQRLPATEPDAASSINSASGVSTAGQTMHPSLASRTGKISDTDESEIVDLYLHSATTEESIQPPAACNVQPAIDVEQPSLRRKYSAPLSNLAPIWLPRNHYGGEGALRTSELWKRRAGNRAPQLRVGKNGEVRGPFDSVTDLDDDGVNNWI
ncbi:hypothetical protein LTR85_003900 [Meristemomyces frigidus]|nr:hypothetical protein LTR85_003900 [Meristemomyces frigidus]